MNLLKDGDTVDGMKSGDHHLRLVVFPILNRVLYVPGGSPDVFHQKDQPGTSFEKKNSIIWDCSPAKLNV